MHRKIFTLHLQLFLRLNKCENSLHIQPPITGLDALYGPVIPHTQILPFSEHRTFVRTLSVVTN